ARQRTHHDACELFSGSLEEPFRIERTKAQIVRDALMPKELCEALCLGLRPCRNEDPQTALPPEEDSSRERRKHSDLAPRLTRGLYRAGTGLVIARRENERIL